MPCHSSRKITPFCSFLLPNKRDDLQRGAKQVEQCPHGSALWLGTAVTGAPEEAAFGAVGVI